MVAVAVLLLLLQMIQQGTNNVYPEVEGLSILLNFKTQNAGCCKVRAKDKSVGLCCRQLMMCCFWSCWRASGSGGVFHHRHMSWQQSMHICHSQSCRILLLCQHSIH
jgi:hypothetical protein